jgi:hypothetical protein
MPFETAFPFTGNVSDPGFNLFFGAMGVIAVVGHIQNAAGLEFGKNGGIFLDHNEHGTGFATPYLELVERVRFVYSEFHAVKSHWFHGLLNGCEGAGIHCNGSHDDSSKIQVSAEGQRLKDVKQF